MTYECARCTHDLQDHVTGCCLYVLDCGCCGWKPKEPEESNDTQD